MDLRSGSVVAEIECGAAPTFQAKRNRFGPSFLLMRQHIPLVRHAGCNRGTGGRREGLCL